MPLRERPEKVLLAVMVEVYRPPRPDVLEVENDAERPGLALQELHDLVPCRPRDRDVLASNAHEQMSTAQLFPRHDWQPSRGHCCSPAPRTAVSAADRFTIVREPARWCIQ